MSISDRKGNPAGAPVAKDALRLLLTAARDRRSAEDRAQAGAALARAAAGLTDSPVVAAYIGVGNEPPTRPMLSVLGEGAEVLLPVVRPGGLLEWAAMPHSPDLLERGPMGLLEPPPPYLGPNALLRAGLVLVPALAVDRGGNRLGRGRGYYDRSLARLTHSPLPARVLAVVFEDELVDAVPAEAHDRRVDGALLPSGVVMFSG